MKRNATSVSIAVLLSCAGCAPPAGTGSVATAPAAPSGHPGLERDRRAILAMAGEFAVTFQFRETVPIREGYRLAEPQHSTGTELVEVLEDGDRRIVLQHVLVGAKGDRVVKHWRQVWQYEDPLLYEFRGERTWSPRRLSAEERAGTWSQAVFQVDDSPRYEGAGRWTHENGISSWTSNETWRPLPRREYTVRSDYDVLVGVNRHTLMPDGWVHEQDNRKLVLADGTVLAREAGLNVYRRVESVDFSAGREYWRETNEFWADVRGAWDGLLNGSRTLRLRDEVDGKKLWEHFFGKADSVRAAGRYDSAEGRAWIDAMLQRFVERSPGEARARSVP